MKRSEHHCSVPGCENVCPRAYPFCYSCWLDVPKDLRAAVRKELAKRETPDLDRSALYLAISVATASVKEGLAGPSAQRWEDAYKRAGSPMIDERVLGLL